MGILQRIAETREVNSREITQKGELLLRPDIEEASPNRIRQFHLGALE